VGVGHHVPVDGLAVERRHEALLGRLVLVRRGDREHQIGGLGDIQDDPARDVALHVPTLARGRAAGEGLTAR
jgi:hypothetical protein